MIFIRVGSVRAGPSTIMLEGPLLK